MDTVGVQVLLILALTAVGGYFAAAEIALISARRAALQQRADEGSSGAKTALKLIEDPTRLLSTIQICITAVGFLAASAGAVTLAKPLAAWLAVLRHRLAHERRLGARGRHRDAADHLPLAHLRRAGAQAARASACRARSRSSSPHRCSGSSGRSRPSCGCSPSRPTWSLGLIGMKSKGGRPGVSEEEIKLLVTEQGTLLEEEKRMIHEIFELGDTVAREIMVPACRHGARARHHHRGSRPPRSCARPGFSRIPIYSRGPRSRRGRRAAQGPRQPALRGRPRRTDHRAHARGGVRPRDQGHPAAALGDACHAQPDGDRGRRVRRHRRSRHDGGHRRGDRGRDRRRVRPRPSLHPAGGSARVESSTAGCRSRRPASAASRSRSPTSTRPSPVGCSRSSATSRFPGRRYERKGWQFRVQTMRRRRIARIRVPRPEEHLERGEGGRR